MCIDSKPRWYYSTPSPKFVDLPIRYPPYTRRAYEIAFKKLHETAICSTIPSLSLSRVFSTHHQCIDLTEIIMAEDSLKILEERLTRLEATLQRASAAGGPSAGGGFTAVP